MRYPNLYSELLVDMLGKMLGAIPIREVVAALADFTPGGKADGGAKRYERGQPRNVTSIGLI